MAPDDGVHVLADPKNGVVTPVYSDRQIVRASDLTLDRESHDAALARMRRLLHGWGIVSGFVPEVVEGKPGAITLSPGYAVAPSGAEVFLPETVLLRDLVDRIQDVCGPDGSECEDLTPEAQRKARAAKAALNAANGAWLIARPAHTATDPRPGVPEGCENPGNMQLPTRHCHMVRLELLCDLPPEKLVRLPSCKNVSPYVCVPEGAIHTVPYPYPPLPSSDEDFVVIGYLKLVPAFGDAVTHVEFLGLNVTPILAQRRIVLPNAVLQDFLQACVCGAAQPERPEGEERPVPDPEPGDGPIGRPGDGPIGRPGGGRIPWDVYIPDVELIPVDIPRDVGVVIPDDGHTDPPPFVLDAKDRLKDLADVGIDGPETFLRMDVEDLVLTTGLPAETVLNLKKDIVATSDLWTTDTSAPAVSESWEDFNVVMFDGGVSSTWNASPATPARDSIKTEPLLTTIADSPDALRDKGFAGPADVLASSDAALAGSLGISVGEAAAVKTDLMRFAGLMGGAPG